MRYFRYFLYVVKHKWFVLLAGTKTGAPLWRLVIHDWSKFLPCEFFPYADRFYGPKIPDPVGHDKTAACQLCAEINRRKKAFDAAWLHHQHFNPHHWEHWILRLDFGAVALLEIPEKFVREMVADWMGAGRAITGKWEARSWYEKNKERILLHPGARALAESLLAR